METAKQMLCHHNWRFDDDQFITDADGWLRGPATCLNCADRTYLWFFPRGGVQPPIGDDNVPRKGGVIITSKGPLTNKGKVQ